MNLTGKRKFLAYMITLGMFFLLLSFVILAMTSMSTTLWDNSTLTGLGIFAGALGAALTGISGAFYVGNAAVHRFQNKDIEK